MRYILLILFVGFGMGCQTMKAKNQARKGWKRVDKEWFGIQAKAPASKKVATRTPRNVSAINCNAVYSNFTKEEYGASAVLDFNYKNIAGLS